MPFFINHCENVASYAVYMQGTVFDPALFMAGLFHDLGKMRIPYSILETRGVLTAEEYEVVKKHSHYGSSMLDKRSYSDKIIRAVLHHHERWDGNGYPGGLKGENIPLYSRILAVADSFDAMTADRPYRRHMSQDAALTEIAVNAGTQFDPNVVEMFLLQMKQKGCRCS